MGIGAPCSSRRIGMLRNTRGQYKVNPTATILSYAWMIEYLGEKEKMNAIFRATENVIAEGRHVTYDLGRSASMIKMIEAIAGRIRMMLEKDRWRSASKVLKPRSPPSSKTSM